MENPSDPTHTQDLRNSAYTEVLYRYGEVSRFAESAIDSSDIGESPQEDEESAYEQLLLLLTGASYAMVLDEDRLASWLTDLVEISYHRGKLVAERDLRIDILSNPSFHRKRLTKVQQKALAQLTKNVNQMVLALQDNLRDAELKSLRKSEAKKVVLDTIDRGGTNAALRTVRTEIVYANQLATVYQGDLTEEETGLEVNYRWQTREDSRVRDRHAAWNGKVYTREEVVSRFGEPNCRCAVHPVIEASEPAFLQPLFDIPSIIPLDF